MNRKGEKGRKKNPSSSLRSFSPSASSPSDSAIAEEEKTRAQGEREPNDVGVLSGGSAQLAGVPAAPTRTDLCDDFPLPVFRLLCIRG